MKKYRFKTKQEFEATCKKDSAGYYECGSAYFIPAMYHLFGQPCPGLGRFDNWLFTESMVVEIEEDPRLYKEDLYIVECNNVREVNEVSEYIELLLNPNTVFSGYANNWNYIVKYDKHGYDICDVIYSEYQNLPRLTFKQWKSLPSKTSIVDTSGSINAPELVEDKHIPDVHDSRLLLM